MNGRHLEKWLTKLKISVQDAYNQAFVLMLKAKANNGSSQESNRETVANGTPLILVTCTRTLQLWLFLTSKAMRLPSSLLERLDSQQSLARSSKQTRSIIYCRTKFATSRTLQFLAMRASSLPKIRKIGKLAISIWSSTMMLSRREVKSIERIESSMFQRETTFSCLATLQGLLVTQKV